MTRRNLPVDIEVYVLTRSRRRCCLCFALANDISQKKGQIAHINQQRTDNRPENLAFLCFDHHDEYDGKTSQAKGITKGELKAYRDELHEFVESSLALKAQPSAEAPRNLPSLSRVLSTPGDFMEASKAFRTHRTEATEALKDYRLVLAEVARSIKEWTSEIPALMEHPSKSSIRRHFNQIGTFLGRSAAELDDKTLCISRSTFKMFKALETTHVLSTDLEFMTPELLLEKQAELAAQRTTIEDLRSNAKGARDAILGWKRSTSEFNRGRRLFVATIDSFCEEMARELQALQDQEYVLGELTTLL